MGKITFDPQNIPGAKLAQIGRAALGLANDLDGIQKFKIRDEVKQYTDVAWLDNRVDEICRKGRI